MIGRAVGEALVFAVGVALSPLAIVAVLVMLVAPHGTRSAGAFVAGWVLSLAVVCTLVVLIADGADASVNGAPAIWVSVVKVVVALLLVVVGARQWRGRGADAEAPRWLRQLDSITMPRAAGLAALFNVVKPKNLLLTIGAGVAMAQVGASSAAEAIAIAVFVALATVGVGIPLAIRLLMADRSRDILTRLRDWMVRENATIISVLVLAIAAKLLGDAIVSLTS